jgi:NAD(P)-dependent dehydrogenase (short-subunit alcohol dehydrogenase family)
MAAVIALAALGLFAAGACAGVIGVVSLAIRREERSLTLIGEATGHLTRAGRWLNGVYVRTPRRAAAAMRQRAPV